MVVGQAGGPTLNILHDGTNPMNPALRVNEDGNVGIGTTAPTSRFEVNGMLTASNLRLTSGAAAGAVLTADANGVATWQTPTTGGSSSWIDSGFNILLLTLEMWE